jgi:hypothetical protein
MRCLWSSVKAHSLVVVELLVDLSLGLVDDPHSQPMLMSILETVG